MATRLAEKAVVKRLIYVNLKAAQHQKSAHVVISLAYNDDVIAENGEAA
jgi:hypothetical protein